MTAATVVMRISRRTGQGIIMTVGTCCRIYLHKSAVIRGGRMGILPGVRMTRRAVTACIADRQAD